jgi:DHA1 family multidrug/chloramphenicol efflux transport protein-like MFS transporter
MIIISFGCSMLFGPLNRLAIEACSEPMGRRTAIFSNGISLAGVLTGVILGVMDSEGVLAIAVLIFICIILTAIVTYKSYSPNSE